MRKGIVLTDRDYSILRHLSYGPSTSESLLEEFFLGENLNAKTRARVMTRRLKKLTTENSIKRQSNPRIPDTIYVLDERGATHVADWFGVEVSNAWTHFPKKTDIFHDLMVAELAKMVAKEGASLKKHELVFVFNECYLKKEQGVKKGVSFPDLRVGLSTSDQYRILDIEVDCGTVSRKDIRGKIQSFEGSILFVVRSSKRMNLLVRYIAAMNTNKSDVYIALYDDILKDGFFTGRWYTQTCPEGTSLMID